MHGRTDADTIGEDSADRDADLREYRTINGILAMRAFRDQFSTGYTDSHGLALEPSQTAILVAILSVGTVLGALLAAPVGDHFGRRLSLIGAVTVFNFGCIFQVCAQAIPMMLVGRYVG